MRFRAGILCGLALGYYLGTKAGRERYDQINRALRRARGSDAFEMVSGKARAVVDLGVERARDAVENIGHHNGSDPVGARSD